MTTEEFDFLSREQKAILVIKDILEQIRLSTYIPEEGTYIDNFPKMDDTMDIKENFDKIKECTVCALGAILLSCTHLGNRLTFNDLSITHLSRNTSSKIRQLFLSIFDAKQLLLIETAFENYSNDYDLKRNYDFCYYDRFDKYSADVLGEELTKQECIDCINFYIYYRGNDKERLIAICNNIINNNGIFVPSKF